MKRASTVLAAFQTALQRAQSAQSPNASPAALEAALRQGSGALEDAAAWGWRWDAQDRERLFQLCENGRYEAFLAESWRMFSDFVANAQAREFECISEGHGVATIQTLAEVEDNLFESEPSSNARERCATLLFSRLVTAEVGDVLFHEDPFHGPEEFRRLS